MEHTEGRLVTIDGAKAELRHNAQSTVKFVLDFLSGACKMKLDDGSVVTLHVLNREELISVIGTIPETLANSIKASYRDKYKGKLADYSLDDKNRLLSLVQDDWTNPKNIEELVAELNGTFHSVFKSQIVENVDKLSLIISGRGAVIMDGVVKSVNKATDEQIKDIVTQKKQEFIQWIQSRLEKEDPESERGKFVVKIKEYVETADFSDKNVLNEITKMLA